MSERSPLNTQIEVVGTTADQDHRARLYVCSVATDNGDAKQLMQMLGLLSQCETEE